MPYIILYQRQDGDSTQITRNNGGNEESLILLPNGRRATAHVIAAGMDVMVADPETGELQEYGEGSLPGNLMTLVQDAGGHVVNFSHGHVGPWTGPDDWQDDDASYADQGSIADMCEVPGVVGRGRNGEPTVATPPSAGRAASGHQPGRRQHGRRRRMRLPRPRPTSTSEP